MVVAGTGGPIPQPGTGVCIFLAGIPLPVIEVATDQIVLSKKFAVVPQTVRGADTPL